MPLRTRVAFSAAEHAAVREAARGLRREGFEPAEVTRWCAEAGLESGEPLVLSASAANRDQLTVVLWTADKPRAAAVVADPTHKRPKTKALQEIR